MKWLENMKNIAIDGTPGKCPMCGSQNTDYTCTVVNGKDGYMDIWCNDCKRAHHISRMKIADNMKTFNAIPEGLKY